MLNIILCIKEIFVVNTLHWKKRVSPSIPNHQCRCCHKTFRKRKPEVWIPDLPGISSSEIMTSLSEFGLTSSVRPENQVKFIIKFLTCCCKADSVWEEGKRQRTDYYSCLHLRLSAPARNLSTSCCNLLPLGCHLELLLIHVDSEPKGSSLTCSTQGTVCCNEPYTSFTLLINSY